MNSMILKDSGKKNEFAAMYARQNFWVLYAKRISEKDSGDLERRGYLRRMVEIWKGANINLGRRNQGE